MKDTLATHRRLIAAGLSEDQAKTLLRLIIDAEAGSFNRRSVQDAIEAANFSAAQANLLISELFERLAQKGAAP